MRDRLIELIDEFRELDAPNDGRTWTEHLADHLLANGVIVPPVAVGGTVYTLNRGRVKEWKVCFIGLNTRGEIKFRLADDGYKHMIEAWDYDIGQMIFLTREEAEKALKERSEG